MKKRKRSIVVLLTLLLTMMLIPMEASAASKSTKAYSSRPCNQYVVYYGNFCEKDGFKYEHYVKVKTKKAKKSIKLIENKGGRLGCYDFDNQEGKVSFCDYTDKTSKHYSGTIKYWVYENGSSKVVASGTSHLDHSEYIKLPKAGKTYKIKVRFYIDKKTHTRHGVGAAVRYVGGKYPTWYLKYDTTNFYTPTVSSEVIYPIK